MTPFSAAQASRSATTSDPSSGPSVTMEPSVTCVGSARAVWTAMRIQLQRRSASHISASTAARRTSLFGRVFGIVVAVLVTGSVFLPTGLAHPLDQAVTFGGALVLALGFALIYRRFGPRCPRCHTNFQAERKAAIAAGTDRMAQIQQIWQKCPHCELPFDQPYRRIA